MGANGHIISAPDKSEFDALVAAVLMRLESDASKRQYFYTYRKWAKYCEGRGISPIMGLVPEHIYHFLLTDTRRNGASPTYKTRLNQMAHLRKLVSVLAMHNRERWGLILADLMALKPPVAGASENERPASSLGRYQIAKIYGVWERHNPLHARNRCFLAIGFATGMRISEVCALRWSDIDFAHWTIRVRKGKGRKSREVAIIPGLWAEEALEYWRSFLPGKREFVFCPVYRGGHIGKDQPIRTITAQKIVEKTRLESGIFFTYHWERYTMVTEALAAGASPADVMAQGGWANPDTMLKHYAKGADARRRRTRLAMTFSLNT